jgi:hypothetical protein
MNGYICFYKNQKYEVYAETSHEAQKKATTHFKVKSNKAYMITVILAENDGKQITHKTSDL